MVLYNTLMGVCAGAIMLLVGNLVHRSATGRLAPGPAPLHGPALLALGVPLTALSLHMALTWPLNVNPPINIAFAEPCLVLGVLATIAGGFLTVLSGRSFTVEDKVLAPVRWVVFAVGLVLASTASAILSYDLVGDAPPQEPITGQFAGWENTFFFAIYALAALGCLLAPWVSIARLTVATRVAVWAWELSGLAFLLFSVLNYRTHIGLLINLERGTSYRW